MTIKDIEKLAEWKILKDLGIIHAWTSTSDINDIKVYLDMDPRFFYFQHDENDDLVNTYETFRICITYDADLGKQGRLDIYSYSVINDTQSGWKDLRYYKHSNTTQDWKDMLLHAVQELRERIEWLKTKDITYFHTEESRKMHRGRIASKKFGF